MMVHSVIQTKCEMMINVDGKYLASIINNSVISCDEIVEETKAVTTNFNAKMQSVKQNFFSSYVPFY